MKRHFDADKDCPTLKAATRAFVERLLADCLEPMRIAARGCGYALATHGSLSRDIDIIAIAWVQNAQPKEALLDTVIGALRPYCGRAVQHGEWSERPHGRMSTTILLGGSHTPHIDLSLMPPGAGQ